MTPRTRPLASCSRPRRRWPARTSMCGAASTATVTAAMMARPAWSPFTRATRGREWAASRLWENAPSSVRSKGAPSWASARTAAGPSVASNVATAASTRPAPAAMVSAACRAGASSAPSAAAMPPCAQAEEQPWFSGASVSTNTLAGAAASAAVRPARPAPTTSTPGWRTRVIRSAPRRRGGGPSPGHSGRAGTGAAGPPSAAPPDGRVRRWRGPPSPRSGDGAGPRRCSRG